MLAAARAGIIGPASAVQIALGGGIRNDYRSGHEQPIDERRTHTRPGRVGETHILFLPLLMTDGTAVGEYDMGIGLLLVFLTGYTE